MEIVKNPWEKELKELITKSKRSIKITSPFIKNETFKNLFGKKIKYIKIELITSIKITSLYSGFLDLDPLEDIINSGGNVYNHSRLHAKLYIFDDEIAIITSANLTPGGLHHNYEYGIKINGDKILINILKDFKLLKEHKDTGLITKSYIDNIRNIMINLDRQKVIKIIVPDKRSDEKIETIETDISSILTTLAGWKKDVFICVNNINKKNFSLTDIYRFEPYFKQKYPHNKHIKDKIRQQLQYLRDLGLIEFLGNGKYRKLITQKD